jgi:TolB protein
VGYPGHDPEIYTINASGRDKIQLTHNNKNEFDLSYSPNGKRIAFAGSSEKSHNIYTISARGGGKSKVTEGSDPDYSPNGKKIVYIRGRGRNPDVYTINVGGGGKSKVTEGSSPSWGSRP